MRENNNLSIIQFNFLAKTISKQSGLFIFGSKNNIIFIEFLKVSNGNSKTDLRFIDFFFNNSLVYKNSYIFNKNDHINAVFNNTLFLENNYFSKDIKDQSTPRFFNSKFSNKLEILNCTFVLLSNGMFISVGNFSIRIINSRFSSINSNRYGNFLDISHDSIIHLINVNRTNLEKKISSSKEVTGKDNVTFIFLNCIFNDINTKIEKYASSYLSISKNSKLNLKNCAFKNYRNKFKIINLYESSVIEIINSSFIDINGGVFELISKNNISIVNCMFKNIFSTRNSGIIFCFSYNILIFIKNSCINSTVKGISEGGGSFIAKLNNNCRFYQINLTISESILFEGGFLFLINSNKLIIKNCFFYDLKAFSGGFISMDSLNALVIQNSKFNNVSGTNKGGILKGFSKNIIILKNNFFYIIGE